MTDRMTTALLMKWAKQISLIDESIDLTERQIVAASSIEDIDLLYLDHAIADLVTLRNEIAYKPPVLVLGKGKQ